MRDNNCTKDCHCKRCKTLGTLTRLENTSHSNKAGFGKWTYNAGFIAQLVSQKNEPTSQARANRKAPAKALEAYSENQKIIDMARYQPLAKTA